MKLVEVRSIAKTHGIRSGHLSKKELVKLIQKEEGNFDCFATAYGGLCDQTTCSWREDCFTVAREAVAV